MSSNWNKQRNAKDTGFRRDLLGVAASEMFEQHPEHVQCTQAVIQVAFT